MSRKTLCLLYVGGTIGMEKGAAGYAPQRGLQALVSGWLTQDARLQSCRHEFHTCEPLIDSANAVPANWLWLAAQLWARRDQADGFVVLHGTDTLAYTASALSFLMRGFGKPIVLTGAQLPASVAGSDAQANLVGAALCAIHWQLQEVAVFFGGMLLRGNRVRKLSSQALDGFRSPHWPALATLAEEAVFNAQALLQAPPTTLLARAPVPVLPSFDGISAGLVKLYPGISGAMICAAAQAHPQGLVLELYGAGAGPSADKSVMQALREAAARAIPIVGVSQCFHGRVELGYNEAGQALADCGVIDGADLTPEAALTKLYYLAGSRALAGTASSGLAQAVRDPIAGEVSP